MKLYFAGIVKTGKCPCTLRRDIEIEVVASQLSCQMEEWFTGQFVQIGSSDIGDDSIRSRHECCNMPSPSRSPGLRIYVPIIQIGPRAEKGPLHIRNLRMLQQPGANYARFQGEDGVVKYRSQGVQPSKDLQDQVYLDSRDLS